MITKGVTVTTEYDLRHRYIVLICDHYCLFYFVSIPYSSLLCNVYMIRWKLMIEIYWGCNFLVHV